MRYTFSILVRWPPSVVGCADLVNPQTNPVSPALGHATRPGPASATGRHAAYRGFPVRIGRLTRCGA
ncbi:hypothetical protein [Micromonospora haikouensis]|uniref:hypothetical protein n=1 Tax=Micromonospora haikouensis TaxID=686309 RepID=UPI00379531C9